MHFKKKKSKVSSLNPKHLVTNTCSCPGEGLLANRSLTVQFWNETHTLEACLSSRQPSDAGGGTPLYVCLNSARRGQIFIQWLCCTESTGRSVLAVTESLWQEWRCLAWKCSCLHSVMYAGMVTLDFGIKTFGLDAVSWLVLASAARA